MYLVVLQYRSSIGSWWSLSFGWRRDPPSPTYYQWWVTTITFRDTSILYQSVRTTGRKTTDQDLILSDDSVWFGWSGTKSWTQKYPYWCDDLLSLRRNRRFFSVRLLIFWVGVSTARTSKKESYQSWNFFSLITLSLVDWYFSMHHLSYKRQTTEIHYVLTWNPSQPHVQYSCSCRTSDNSSEIWIISCHFFRYEYILVLWSTVFPDVITVPFFLSPSPRYSKDVFCWPFTRVSLWEFPENQHIRVRSRTLELLFHHLC